MNKETFIVTGGAGFIGSAFARLAIKSGYNVVVLDALTYAGHRANLAEIEKQIEFVHGSICDRDLVQATLKEFAPDAIFHFAAESHVDNSISGPAVFVETNVVGTFNLLEESRQYCIAQNKKNFRFIHVSTDEVFGELGPTGKFAETTPYSPRSPYSATKAASDHLASAWWHTYKFPSIITNCSNNYGPRQFPEKLIPRMITQCLKEEPLPVYGQGKNIRDWIHVDDHSRGVLLAFQRGEIGESYCFGGDSERENIQVVTEICSAVDKIAPRKNGKSHCELIRFVEDRKGHDFRYAIDSSKAKKDLGYAPLFPTFEAGLKETIQWYLANGDWLNQIKRRAL